MALSLDGTTGISASGNIVGNNISVSGTLSAGSFSPSSVSTTGNVTGGNLVTGGLITATGNVTGGNVIAVGTVKGVTIDSTNADLAERYRPDQEYVAGTVVVFAGDQEITQSCTYADPRIAGVISTAPAYRMNTDADGQYVALQGRVPCRIVGKISKGDLITSSDQPGVATGLDPADWRPGCVIGKALEPYDSAAEGTIEVVVGRL